MSKIYVSGRISGLPLDTARRRFAQAQDTLERQGWEVINPLNNGLPADAPWEDHLAEDIINLFACKAIYMLDGWECSQGAIIEHALARRINMRVIYQNEAERND